MPSLASLRRDWFANPRAHILAGIVVALALIPEATGFSVIAGVGPRVGLYASFSIAVIIAFIPMRLMGVSSNIMSLGGIAIAVGAMVDAAIVVVEQTHKKLELWDRTGRKDDYDHVLVTAVKEVGGPSFFALLVIAVSFLPVLTLEAQEGRLFRPLAMRDTLAGPQRVS